ncbi:MAG: DUF4870 domain-containing protein [Myxococcaceae bacterium]|nr:DUF4870 domain-containing protein [Myxococcaceae bacterium]
MSPDNQLESQAIKTVEPPVEAVRDQDKIHLVLAYLGILALIPLLTVKDSPYVQWHAKNGLVFGIAGMVGLPVLSALFGWIPFIGWLFSCALVLAFLVVDILAMVKALSSVRWRIPVFTDFAEKL